MGPELIDEMRVQAERFGAEIDPWSRDERRTFARIRSS